MRFFHSWPDDRDPADLLDPNNHHSTPWGEGDHGRCDKCGGGGRVAYACRSCHEEAREDCPACAGRVRFEDVCPACEGSGEISRTRRVGISCFPTAEGLRRYLAERDEDLDGYVVVEFEGRPSGDRDLDADQGAMLAIPEEIVATHDLDLDRIDELRGRG